MLVDRHRTNLEGTSDTPLDEGGTMTAGRFAASALLRSATDSWHGRQSEAG